MSGTGALNFWRFFLVVLAVLSTVLMSTVVVAQDDETEQEVEVTCAEGELVAPRIPTGSRGAVITAPCEVIFDPESPVYGERSFDNVFADIRIVGSYLFDTSCEAIEARQASDGPNRAWVWVENVDTGQRYSNALDATAALVDEPPPSDPVPCEARINMAAGGRINVNAADIIELPATEAVYDIYVTFGSVETNRVRVRVLRAPAEQPL